MAKPSSGNYFYMNKNGSIFQDISPGRDRKTGLLKSPHGIQDARCWTERGMDCWHFPNGKTEESVLEDYGRTEILASLASELAQGQVRRKDKESGQHNMFDMFSENKSENKANAMQCNIPKLPLSVLIDLEKECLGFCMTQFICKADQYDVPFELCDELVQMTKMDGYAALCLLTVDNIPDLPFWRYAMDEEWKPAWRNEWANRVSDGKDAWWKNEIKAFLSIVKELSEKNVEIGDITKETLVIIKERFSKKKEVS